MKRKKKKIIINQSSQLDRLKGERKGLRGHWSETRVVPSKKAYKRKPKHEDLND